MNTGTVVIVNGRRGVVTQNRGLHVWVLFDGARVNVLLPVADTHTVDELDAIHRECEIAAGNTGNRAYRAYCDGDDDTASALWTVCDLIHDVWLTVPVAVSV